MLRRRFVTGDVLLRRRFVTETFCTGDVLLGDVLSRRRFVRRPFVCASYMYTVDVFRNVFLAELEKGLESGLDHSSIQVIKSAIRVLDLGISFFYALYVHVQVLCANMTILAQ